jgi:GNAT superfamily N-acetyltransferase
MAASVPIKPETPLRATIRREVPVIQSARVLQLLGLFDVPPAQRCERCWEVTLELPASWHIGLIVGPSGCGKSTLARELWPGQIFERWDWPADRSVVDGFPAAMGIKDITSLLCAVGFSSPPSWLKPYRVLSTGEQFRVHIARTLAELPGLAVVDEFTSVVDRQVAQLASAAVQKAVRRRGQQLVAVTCHEDVAAWLEPDWIYRPLTGELLAGRSLRRPPIELEIARVHRHAWQLFKEHHYLSGSLHKGAACFVAFWQGRPAAFCSVLSFPDPVRPGWREHRTVCLPDYQGVGIGSALGEYVASLYRATGKPYRSITSNPVYIGHRLRSPLWRCCQRSALQKAYRGRHASRVTISMAPTKSTTRLTSSFEYIGPANPDEARRFGIL